MGSVVCGGGAGAGGSRSLGTAIAAAAATASAGITAALAGFAAAEELDAVGVDAEAAPLLAFLGLPLVELEAALDEDRGALGQKFLGGLGLAAPGHHIDVADLFLDLSVLGLVGAVERHRQVADGGSLGRVAHFGVPGQVPDEHDFIQVGHGKWAKLSCGSREFLSRGRFGLGGLRGGGLEIELAEDALAELELGLEGGQLVPGEGELDVDVETGVDVARDPLEAAAVHLLGALDAAAEGGDFLLDDVESVLDGIVLGVLGLSVQNVKSVVASAGGAHVLLCLF